MDAKIQSNRIFENIQKEVENYEPQPYSGKITLFLASEFRNLSHSLLADLAQAGLEIEEIPGYHDTFLESPQLEKLVAQIIPRLTKA